jgi:hypothetical protein
VNNGENAELQAHLSPFGPANCRVCGDRLDNPVGLIAPRDPSHVCWLMDKVATQESLQPTLPEEATLHERLLRDDGEPVQAPPPYINRTFS